MTIIIRYNINYISLIETYTCYNYNMIKTISNNLLGKKAPNFCLPNQNGKKVCLKDELAKLKDGGMILLFFYPKDMTPGCTTEAISLSEAKRKLSARGVKIFGISKLTPESKQKFIAKHNLKIDLLSDEDMEVCEKYGVWREKNMYGKKVMGIARESFLIGKDGKIIKHFQKVKPATHIDEVLEFLESFKSD